jgi:hypothetical protein
MSTPDAKEHWEEHYVERDRVWSGRVNARRLTGPLRQPRAVATSRWTYGWTAAPRSALVVAGGNATTSRTRESAGAGPALS